MDFMYLNRGDQAIVDFDIRSEIVSKDKFLERAQRYISTDEETLLHRQALFADILRINELSDFLITLSEKLTEYAPLMKYSQASGTEEKLHSVLYPTIYIELVKYIYETLSSFKSSISSQSLKHLYELAKDDIESSEYTRLERYYEKNADRLRSAYSVTIGVNLDALFQPKEAGIISVNKEEFKSGDLLDRIIKLDFEKDEYHCIAPITVIDKKLSLHESQQVNYAFLKAMSKVLDSGLHHCSNRALNYISGKLAKYFHYHDSLRFVVDAINRIKIFKEKSIPLCFPRISQDKSFSVISLYDHTLCRSKAKKDIVPNTITLENNVCCYILTGPNSGGKTVFINSLAAAQYYFQLGMPIPAKEATLPICDAVFKISVEEQANVNLVGRFEKECFSLSEVLKKSTANSLILIDEAFTSTSTMEAVPIAANYIAELCQIGSKCVFITHFHELCETQQKFAECGNKIGYLHAETYGTRRTYTISEGKAKSGSFAQSIAQKYGLITDS